MKVVITAGATVEPIDQVRRLTNFSTGTLGTRLCNYLAGRGHDVTLLRSGSATCSDPCQARQVVPFETSRELWEKLQLAGAGADAVFHAAAVSDFRVGRIWANIPDGTALPLQAGKLPTREGGLLLELVPAPKILAELRNWFPGAFLVGWKYEVDGTRAEVLAKARAQILECATNYCVANGPAYGPGYGLINKSGDCAHQNDPAQLYPALEQAMLTSSAEV
jgi:phosphopantothenoylcysteine decarboxylase/phosphopantothenate--cysteine ligase